MTPTDVALLDEAHWLIDPSFRRFGHVVVDEAQNLTPMELRMTVRRARGQSLTILGDLSQRTADAGVSSWEAVLSEAGVGEHAVSELSISYRVPNDFLVLAGALLPPGRARAARRARRAVPGAVAIDDRRRRRRRRAARGAVRRGGRQRRRVAPHACMDAVRAALGDFVDATGGAALGSGVNLIDLHVAKGLEFDAIVVVEPAAILRRASRRRRRRPLHGAHALDAGARDRPRRSRFPRRFANATCCGQKLTATVRSLRCMDYKLELIAVPVSDVDRAKAFYVDQAGFNADHDHRVNENLRFVQLTPPGSACSIAIGAGRHRGRARLGQGPAAGRQRHRGGARRARPAAASRCPTIQEFPWGAFVFFSDPDGNAWAVQDLTGTPE